MLAYRIIKIASLTASLIVSVVKLAKTLGSK